LVIPDTESSTVWQAPFTPGAELVTGELVASNVTELPDPMSPLVAEDNVNDVDVIAVYGNV
jgi:hypothetical protein